MDCLKGKVAIVTGASSGIGRATAVKLSEMGCRVVVVARREDKLKELADHINESGGESISICADITSEADVQKLFSQTLVEFGTVDILVNNAGRGLKAAIKDIKLEEWQNTVAVNMTGVFLCTKECLKTMSQRNIHGTIITVSSIVGLFPAPGFAAYSASKHGTTGFMWSAYWEAKSLGIKTASIHPARRNTEFFDLNGYSERPSCGQMLSPADVADHIVAIASGSRLKQVAVVMKNIFKRIKGYVSILGEK